MALVSVQSPFSFLINEYSLNSVEIQAFFALQHKYCLFFIAKIKGFFLLQIAAGTTDHNSLKLLPPFLILELYYCGVFIVLLWNLDTTGCSYVDSVWPFVYDCIQLKHTH